MYIRSDILLQSRVTVDNNNVLHIKNLLVCWKVHNLSLILNATLGSSPVSPTPWGPETSFLHGHLSSCAHTYTYIFKNLSKKALKNSYYVFIILNFLFPIYFLS